jgi:hypothetical protein
MTEPSGAGGSGSGGPGSGGGPGGAPPDVASGITEGVSSAATTAAGAQQLENDPVAGATQMVGGAAGVAGAAGVEEAEQVADAASAASSAAEAAQAMEHDPVGGLLGMVEAGAAAAGVAGAQQQATQAVSSAASAAQSAIGAAQGAAGAAQGAGGAAQSAASSASSARAARAQPAAAAPAPAAAAPSGAGPAGGGGSDQASWQFTSADRLHVHYTFHSDADGGDGWRVQRVVLEERMDRPYEAVLDLSNDDTSADPLALLGQPAVLSIERHAVRDVQGVIRRVERGQSGQGQSGRSDRSVSARVFLVPALWTLSQSRNTRIFQEKKVTEILQEVLEAGLGPFQREVQLDLQGAYQPASTVCNGKSPTWTSAIASCRKRASGITSITPATPRRWSSGTRPAPSRASRRKTAIPSPTRPSARARARSRPSWSSCPGVSSCRTRPVGPRVRLDPARDRLQG